MLWLQFLSLQQQGITRTQNYLTRYTLNTLTFTSHCYQNNIIFILKVQVYHPMSHKRAVRSHSSCLEPTVLGNLILIIYMMGGIHQTIRLTKFQNRIYLTRIYQVIATQNKLIGRHRRYNLTVETDNLNQMPTIHIGKS